MSDKIKIERDRAMRIGLRMEDCHLAINEIYEKLVDREFDGIHDKVKILISDLRMMLKSMEDDDF